MVNQPAAPGRRWRVGGRVGRTLYLDDTFVGHVDGPVLADIVVTVMNTGARDGLPAVGVMRAIGRGLYEDGQDVGYLDRHDLALAVIDQINAAYGHPGEPRRSTSADNDALAAVEDILRAWSPQSRTGLILGRLAAEIVTSVRHADARAADLRLDVDSPTTAAGARALLAGYRSEAWRVHIDADASVVAATVLQAASTAMFTAGAAAHLRRLADEEAASSDGNPDVVRILNRHAAEMDGRSGGEQADDDNSS